jgi:hypothetical protein
LVAASHRAQCPADARIPAQPPGARRARAFSSAGGGHENSKQRPHWAAGARLQLAVLRVCVHWRRWRTEKGSALHRSFAGCAVAVREVFAFVVGGGRGIALGSVVAFGGGAQAIALDWAGQRRLHCAAWAFASRMRSMVMVHIVRGCTGTFTLATGSCCAAGGLASPISCAVAIRGHSHGCWVVEYSTGPGGASALRRRDVCIAHRQRICICILRVCVLIGGVGRGICTAPPQIRVVRLHAPVCIV